MKILTNVKLKNVKMKIANLVLHPMMFVLNVETIMQSTMNISVKSAQNV